MIETIGVIGAGGVGGYFGGKLCRLQANGSGVRVCFIARGEHLRAIQRDGLILSSEDEGESVCKPALATDDFQVLPPLDLCLLCVKEFDLSAALVQLAGRVGEKTVIIPLLNGVDVYERVRRSIRHGVVLPACVYVGTHIERAGKVAQKGGACRILFGPDPQNPAFVPAEVLPTFGRAKIEAEWRLDIEADIWKKFIFICGFGLVCAATGKTVGEVLEDERLRRETLAIMLEAESIARASGVELPQEIAAECLAKGRNFPFATKTSFQRDFESRERPDERDLFAGTMLRKAAEAGVEVPQTRAMEELLEKKKPGRRDR